LPFLYHANMMTVADARRFVASREARRSGIAAPLCHIWLPAAPLRQLASSYEHACKSSPALHLMHAWWIPDRVLGKSYFSQAQARWRRSSQQELSPLLGLMSSVAITNLNSPPAPNRQYCKYTKRESQAR
jgi:hypothetical protein